MTDQLSPLAVQHAGLLRAIADGPCGSLSELAGKAEVLVANLNRTLRGLEAESLIVKTGEASHEVELTEAARRAILAMEVYVGGLPPAGAGGGVVMIRLDRIAYSDLNPRTQYDPAGIEELGRSIADKGVLQPLLVRPLAGDFELVIGERRLRSANLAQQSGWVGEDFEVPATIRTLSDDEAYEIAGVENLQREDLHWMDEAEFYKHLADKGKSGAQIVRLVGEGARKKRSVQEFIQFARELSPGDKARTRLPDGDPQRLSVDQCRAMVGNKRERPALDLTPKMAVALLELIDAGEFDAEGAGKIVTVLQTRPIGGPLITLSDRKLLAFKFDGEAMRTIVPVTDELRAWLRQTGHTEDAGAALEKARAGVIGEMASGALAAAGRYLTDELNAQEREDRAADVEDDPEWVDRFAGGSEGEIRTDEHGDRYQLRAGQWEIYAEPKAPASPQAEPAKLELTATQGLTVSEVAHKIEREGAARVGGVWAVVVRSDYYKDPAAQQLIHDRLLMFMPVGATTTVALTPRANEWLAAQGTAQGEDGRFQVGDEALLFLQVAADAASAAGYASAWLNPAPVVEADEPAPSLAGAGFVGDLSTPNRDDFMTQVMTVTAEGRALSRLISAAREAQRVIANATSRKLTPAEADQVNALLTSAIEAAETAQSVEPLTDVERELVEETLDPEGAADQVAETEVEA